MVTPYIKPNIIWKPIASSYNEFELSDGLITKKVKLTPIKNKELFIECECHGEILKIDKFEDEKEYYLTVYRYRFPNISFFRRVKYALDVLRGKGIRTADLVLSKGNFNKIKKFK